MTTYNQEFIDLHVHSNCSDGVFSPTELVKRASGIGLKTISLADHDSVAGINEATAAGNGCSIAIIPAVELSVQFKAWQDVHLLGYGIDHADRIFLEKLNGFRDRRERRNEEILVRVNEMLVSSGRKPVALETVLSFAKDAIGRPHIARALLECGYVESVEDAFLRFLVPCNVPKSYWPIDDAIGEIRRIGGVAVLAHPTTVSTNLQELRTVFLELKEMGLDGIEVYNNLAMPNEMERLRRLADELGLLITAGSDFHGIEEGLEMGRGRGGIRFSTSLLTPLMKLISNRRNVPESDLTLP